MMAPLSPSSISSADAAGNVPSSPRPEATYENPLKAVMKSIAMFSPKNYSETQDDDSNNDADDKVNVSNHIKIDIEEVEEGDTEEEDAPHDEKSGSLIKESPTDEAKFEEEEEAEEEEEELEATEDEQKPTSPTASTTDKPNKHKEKTESTPPSTTKSKKLVSFAEKNPPPLSPMSYQSAAKMLSPASSRDETITSDATSFDEGLNSPDQAISNDNTTAKTQSTTLVDIPDDESEASLMVLMRYMGCTPVPYGSGPQRKPRSTSDVDDHSLLSDQYTYDNDLHSKDTFDTIEPHEIDGIKKSWTLDNDEVGVELDLDTLMINDVKDRLKKHNNNNLSVNTDIEDVPSDEQNGGSVTSPEGGTTTTEEEEGSRDVKFGAMLSVDEKLEKEKNENDGGVGLTSFNNYLEKKGSASLQSESLVSPAVATNPGSPVVKFVTSPGGGVLSDDALHSFLVDKEAFVATGVPTSPVESTTSGLQRLPGGKLSIVTSPSSPNVAAAVTSPVVKFVTSPGGGVLSDDALHSYLASNGDAATPAAVTTVTLPSPTSGEVSKAMAKVAAYKKAMAEVKAASAAAESEKNSKKKLSSLNIDTIPSSQPSDTSFPVDVVQDVNDKVEETASTRSDKENQTDTVEVSSDSKTDTSSSKVAALAVETSPQDDTAVVSTSILSPAKSSVLSPTAKKSVQEVDELLSKTRDWLVRHNESQKKKVPSSSSEEQKVTGKTVLDAIENSDTPPPSSNKKKPNNVTGKSVLNAIELLSPKGTNNNISKESPKTLDEMLQSKKNGTSSNTALLAMLSPKSASEGRTTTTPPTTDKDGPKKSIMEQLEEIRIKQRELESRQPKAKQEEQIETS